MSINPIGCGDPDGRIYSDIDYKRAVYRPPPSRFTVEMLGAAKQGGNYSYGMRISAISRGDRSSISSRGSHSEYEVWRRWEDCLWFQSKLELEYQRMARDKRQRLLRGKGVKHNGFYKQDQASSFESLPPGPDPSSVARNIRKYIPLLTKKGTVFRASQATIDQRATEMSALIEALFHPEVPALVDELRRSRAITNFFGFWRRDQDLAEKGWTPLPKPRYSITNSVFSMYFSASSPNITDSRKSLEARPPSTLRSPRITVPSSARHCEASTDSSDHSPSRIARTRTSSTASSDFSSATSDRSLDSPVITSAPIIADDSPMIPFDHNPLQRSDSHAHDWACPGLAALPEEHEACLKIDASASHYTAKITEKDPSGKSRGVRNGRIFLSSPDKTQQQLDAIKPKALTLSDKSHHESWQTIDSAACMLDGIDIAMPTPTAFSNRASSSSIATMMTNSSADAIIPRTPEASPRRRRNTRPRVSAPVSISECHDDVWSDSDDNHLSDSFSLSRIDLPDVIIHNRPETVLAHNTHKEQLPPSIPSSPTKSFSSASTAFGSPTSEKLSIKARYNDSMIMLRVPLDMPYKDMRQRLYNKFVGQEGLPLSDSFTITYLQPILANPCVDKASESSLTLSSEYQEHLVTSQADWENVTASIEGSKLALCIADKIPSS